MDATNSDGAAADGADRAGNQLQVERFLPDEIWELVCSFMFYSNKGPCGFRRTLFCALGDTPSQPDAQEQAEARSATLAPSVAPTPVFRGR